MSDTNTVYAISLAELGKYMHPIATVVPATRLYRSQIFHVSARSMSALMAAATELGEYLDTRGEDPNDGL